MTRKEMPLVTKSKTTREEEMIAFQWGKVSALH
jgi:hypothetical protein